MPPELPKGARLLDVSRILTAAFTPIPYLPPVLKTHLSAQTRARIGRSQYLRRRAVALKRPDLTPLQRARLNAHGGCGWTIPELGRRAIVGPTVIQDAEAGRPISDNSWFRLARALDVAVEDIRGE